VSVNANHFMKNRKTFTTLKPEYSTDALPTRLALNFRYRRQDYNVPDYLRTMDQRGQEKQEQSAVLSKHMGWITVDSESQYRSTAPEFFQSSNPKQRDKQKPLWMKMQGTSKQENDRFIKCIEFQNKIQASRLVTESYNDFQRDQPSVYNLHQTVKEGRNIPKSAVKSTEVLSSRGSESS